MRCWLVLTAVLALCVAAAPNCAMAQGRTGAPTTPIAHLIVIVGENLSFDNLFATYLPASGAAIANLRSKGVVAADGSPGRDFARAAQKLAGPRGRYEIAPPLVGAYPTLPRPGTTYAFGRNAFAPDERFPADLPNGPFAITRYVDYAAAIGDPVHRFFQMWQQIDGGRMDLFTWVATTSGEGSQSRDDPASGTNQGALAMGFYNMAGGDAAYIRSLADGYALADNYHQPMMGGTGANYFTLATGAVAFYTVDGKAARPPPNQIEDPEPLLGTPNWYRQSGYRSGSFVNCADPGEPGVKAIRDYLAALPYRVFKDGNCQPGHFYLVNNYKPGFGPDGSPQKLGPKRFVLPPQSVPTIAEALAAKGVSWGWYSGGRVAGGIDKQLYCDICDPLTHSAAVMTGPLKAGLRGLGEFMHALDHEAEMPAVAFVVPPNFESGHPAYSTVARFEIFLRGIIEKAAGNPRLWRDTAVLVTTDEGGGYYDSGYLQTLDFFGDGPRIALLAVSPFARRGFVDHTYYDHVSILKFIERNWRLEPLSPTSRDNLPNPVADPADPYVPANRPAIGDLMNLFQF